MTTLDKIKKMVEADPAVAGDDFYERIFKRLNAAMEQAGIDPASAAAMDYKAAEAFKIMEEPFSDVIEPQLVELEESLCLSGDYEIPSHRKGFLGGVNRLVKKIVLKIKLRTDVQVSQQARFNLAALVLLKLTAAQVDVLTGVLEKTVEEKNGEIASLKKEIEQLKGELARLRDRA